MPFRRWLPNFLLALAVAALVIPFPPSSRAQEGCVPVEYFTPLVDRFPVFRSLHGDGLQRASTIYNEHPPFSNTQWQSAFISIRPDGWGFLFLGYSESICVFMRIAPEDMGDLLRRIDGQTV